MASGGSLAETFKKFATKADGKEATTADFNKWCKDAGVYGKNCTPQHVDISFTKVKQKTSK
jgi:p25-alpha